MVNKSALTLTVYESLKSIISTDNLLINIHVGIFPLK